VPQERTAVTVAGRRLDVSSLDKVLYPETGFTKAALMQYYGRVAPVLLPHLAERPATFLRCPGGVDGERFWAKRVPPGAPGWVNQLRVPLHGTGGASMDQVVVTDLPTLMWAGNLDTVEFHVPQWRTAPDRHDRLIIDLDPGPGTTLLHCCAAALAVRAALRADQLDAWPKTSGSKGLHLSVPLRPTPAEAVSRYAKALAQRLSESCPQLLVWRMDKRLRRDRVLLDWSQNASAKTTVGPYSLRALSRPTVSTPVSWQEIESCERPEQLSFTADQAAARVERDGDLWAPLLDPARQLTLPPRP
jgi:bifunctional non-homologous end joining protein LigD